MRTPRPQRSAALLGGAMFFYAAACSGAAGSAVREPASTAQVAVADPASVDRESERRRASASRADDAERWQPDVIAWAPAEHLAGGDGNALAIVDVGRNRVVARMAADVDNPTALAIAPDGKRVILADTSTRGFLVWDVANASTARLNGHRERVLAVALSPDGRRAASVAWNGTALLWDAVTGKQLAKVEINSGTGGSELSAVAFARSGKRLALGTVGGSVCIWNPADGTWKVVARHNQDPEIKPSKILPAVKDLAFTADGQFIVSSGQDQYVLLTDPRKDKRGTSAGPYKYIGVQALAVSAQGDLLAISHADGIDLVRYRVERKRGVSGPQLSRVAHIDIRGGAQSLAFSPDGKRLAASVIGEGVSIWEARTGKLSPLDPR